MALSPEFLAAIGQISRNLQEQRPVNFGGTTDAATNSLAHGLLLNNSADLRGSFNPNPSSHGQSVISRVLDILSRPMYATADAAYESEDAAANHESFWDQVKGLGTGVVHGLSGTQKRSWEDVLQQGHDINDQVAKTGDSAGYQFGQSGPPSTALKLAGIGLNIAADPTLTVSPIKTARAFGEGSELYKIPTSGEVIKNISKRSLAKRGSGTEITQEVAPETVDDPASKLLDINMPAIAQAKSIPDVLEAKIGQPAILSASHPHINVDQDALGRGVLRATGLTPEGQFAADLLHQSKVAKFQSGSASAIRSMAEINPNASFMTHARRYLSYAPKIKESEAIVGNKAIDDVTNSLKPALERNKVWVDQAVKNGVDPARALRVVREVNSGVPFKEAFADAVTNSKVFKSAKILKSGELKGSLKNLTNPAFKLSAVLAPTPSEVLKGVHPLNPLQGANVAEIAKAKQLASLKRVGALSRPLSDTEQTILKEVVQKAMEEIHGTGRATAKGALNDVVQANLWDNIRHRVAPLTNGGAANVSAINARTFHIAAHAEAELERLGFKPIAGDGTPVRLTEAVASNSGYPNKLGALTTKIINGFASGSLVGATAKAEAAIAEAKVAKPIIQKAALQVNQIFADGALSDPVKFLASQRTAKEVERAITIATGSTTAARMGKAIYNSIVNATNLSVTDVAIKNAGRALSEIVSTGKFSGDYDKIVRGIGEAVSQALTKADDVVQVPRVLGVLYGPEARAEIGVLGRMATWMGQHDLRPIVQKRLSSARSNAAYWSKYWHDTFDGLVPEQQVEALRAAQGLFEPVDPAVIQAAQRIRTRMENLLSSSGIQQAAREGKTFATRAALTHDGKYGLNAELKRVGSNLKLVKGTVKDLFQEDRDYSQGTDWLNSWEAHKFTGSPGRELAKIETAVFNAAAKKAIFDDIRDRFGAPLADAERNSGIRDFPLLKGAYFHPEIAQQIPRVIRDLYAATPATSPLLRQMDNIIRMWKTGVTIYAPSHAIRNGMGDIYNNWIAGVNSVRPYSKAIKVMAANRNDYKSLEKLGLMVGQRNAMDQILTQIGQVPGDARAADRIVASTRDGQKLTAAQVKMAAHNQGILLAVEHIEDIGDVNGGLGGLSKFQPFGGRVSAAAHGFVQGMDHFTRLAHFIHGIENGSGNLKEIFDAAGREVRKFHPDGMDLTNFERTVLRRIIPFYSWTRKAIPFSIEGMLAKPSKFMAYPKAITGLNYGNASNISPGQEFPSDQLFPSWITDLGIGPVGNPGGFLDELTGGAGGYVTASPGIPPIDILQGYGNHPNQGILGGLNPLAKVPIELMQGKTIDTGIPLPPLPEYLGEQIPSVNLIQRLTNVGLGGTTSKGQSQGIWNAQNLVNYLTGLKLTNTGQYIKQAQYEAHLKQTQAKKNNRDFMKNFLNGSQ